MDTPSRTYTHCCRFPTLIDATSGFAVNHVTNACKLLSVAIPVWAFIIVKTHSAEAACDCIADCCCFTTFIHSFIHLILHGHRGQPGPIDTTPRLMCHHAFPQPTSKKQRKLNSQHRWSVLSTAASGGHQPSLRPSNKLHSRGLGTPK